jgi:hypothetical protein
LVFLSSATFILISKYNIKKVITCEDILSLDAHEDCHIWLFHCAFTFNVTYKRCIGDICLYYIPAGAKKKEGVILKMWKIYKEFLKHATQGCCCFMDNALRYYSALATNNHFGTLNNIFLQKSVFMEQSFCSRFVS